MEYAALISQLVGTVGGAAASQMSNDQALALIKSVSDEYGKIDIPALQKLVLQQQGPSQLAGIKDDAGYRAQQQAGDAQLNDVINSGGLTLSDKAALNNIQQKTARTESMGRNAITQGAAARGGIDSGAQLATQLSNQQNSAENLNQQGENTAGNAQARAYAAIQQRSANASAGLNRTNQLAEDKARAADAISAGNAAIANTAAKYNAGIPQQNFANQLGLANAKAAPLYATAGQTAANGQNTQKNMQAVGNLGAAALNSKSGSSAGSSNGAMTSPDDWNAYPGNGPGAPPPTPAPANSTEPGTPSWDSGSSSDALSSPGTRPARQKTVVGYDDNNQPIYGYASAS